jgi:hypothetical protein
MRHRLWMMDPIPYKYKINHAAIRAVIQLPINMRIPDWNAKAQQQRHTREKHASALHATWKPTIHTPNAERSHAEQEAPGCAVAIVEASAPVTGYAPDTSSVAIQTSRCSLTERSHPSKAAFEMRSPLRVNTSRMSVGDQSSKCEKLKYNPRLGDQSVSFSKVQPFLCRMPVNRSRCGSVKGIKGS